jgi:hypothetical protein
MTCGFGIVFFGLPGSLNDINVLHRYHLFAKLASGEAPDCNYKVNGHYYTMGYYLADDIYPSWGTFVKTIPRPKTKKKNLNLQRNKICRKDVERDFGALQARFAIVHGPTCFWDKKSLINIMKACVILHNMIIKDERDLNLEFFFDNVGSRVRAARNLDHIQAFLETYRQIEDSATHSQLNKDLMEHHW